MIEIICSMVMETQNQIKNDLWNTLPEYMKQKDNILQYKSVWFY